MTKYTPASIKEAENTVQIALNKMKNKTMIRFIYLKMLFIIFCFGYKKIIYYGKFLPFYMVPLIKYVKSGNSTD